MTLPDELAVDGADADVVEEGGAVRGVEDVVRHPVDGDSLRVLDARVDDRLDGRAHQTDALHLADLRVHPHDAPQRPVKVQLHRLQNLQQKKRNNIIGLTRPGLACFDLYWLVLLILMCLNLTYLGLA